ncbi:hypothetical protein [Methylobacterium organophilum]|uniref:DUF551 domain-containing protein n=1 Tax=Methylobacterium organophilum TaxID=410 RepID=A0ABQ4T1X0_METOR|nr:hypothetical protein [Methylobacterium organophilum]UMY18847.1 hypothetical protein MMB17_05935 [Methylobacterium organophilum]GJE25636.1 hypothetical protein LKMONMHP_0474 [Methylobacterium organophilum]
MRSWIPIGAAPHDGRWIIAINRYEPDRRAVVRWDPARHGDDTPWHVASCDHGYAEDAFTDWQPFPHWPEVEAASRPPEA